MKEKLLFSIVFILISVVIDMSVYAQDKLISMSLFVTQKFICVGCLGANNPSIQKLSFNNGAKLVFFMSVKQTVNTLPVKRMLALVLKQILISSYENVEGQHKLFNYYSLHLNRQNYLIAWVLSQQEEQQWKHVWGGGIENPFVTLGTFYEHGAYKLFEDIVDSSVWQDNSFQHSRWSIRRSAVQTPVVGARVSLPQIFDKYGLLPNLRTHSSSRSPKNISDSEIGSATGSHPNTKSGTHTTNTNKKTLPKYFSNDALAAFTMAYIPLDTNIATDTTNTLYQPWAQDGYSFLGGDLGYNFGFWQPRILYRYYTRQSLTAFIEKWDTSDWVSWLLRVPTALTLHHSVFSNTISIKDFLWAELAIKLSASDTLPHQFSGKALARYKHTFFELGAEFAMAESYSIDNSWKYTKYLWNTTSELIVYYGNILLQSTRQSHAYMRLRTEFAEYNPVRYNLERSQSLRRVYRLKWVHQMFVEWEEIPKRYFFGEANANLKSNTSRVLNDGASSKTSAVRNQLQTTHTSPKKIHTITLTPQFEYGYNYTNTDEYHLSVVKLEIDYLQFSPSVRNRIYWYINESAGTLKKIEIAQRIFTKYKFERISLSLWLTLTWNLSQDFEQDYIDKNIIYEITKDLETEVGAYYKIGKLAFRLSTSYVFAEDNDYDTKQFKHQFFVNASLTARW